MVPYSEEAEKGLLGSILQESTKILDLCIENKLNVEAFYVPAHREIFAAMGTLLTKGRPVDVLTVSEQLKRTGKLAKVGGGTYLDRLIDATPTTSHCEHYIFMLREAWLRRKIVAAAHEAAALAYDCEDPELLRSQVEVAFTTMHANASTKSVASVWGKLEEAVLAGLEGRPQQVGINTGMPELDKVNTGGMRPGSIYWLSGKQKSGKTRMKRNITALLLGAGRKVASCVQEGTMADEIEGLANILIDASLGQMMLGLSRKGKDDIPRAKRMIVESGLFLCTDTTEVKTTVEFRSWARRQVTKFGAEIIMLDYLQRLMIPESGKKGMEEITSEKVSCLEQTAQELGVPMLVLAAINDAGDVRGSRYADYTGAAHWQLSRETESTRAPDHCVELKLWVKEARYAASDQEIELVMNGRTGLIEHGRLNANGFSIRNDTSRWSPEDELTIA